MELYVFLLNIISLSALCFGLGYKFGLKDGRPRWFNEGYEESTKAATKEIKKLEEREISQKFADQINSAGGSPY